MSTPRVTPVKVPAMPKPARIQKPTVNANHAPEFAGEQRPRSVFHPVRLENKPSHWSGH